MEWTEDAIILAARRHGETSAITTVLSPSHGRFAGLVHGGAGKAKRGIVQTGNQVQAHWRARLPEHLGTLTLELVHGYAASVLDTPLRLKALQSACAVAETVLPEREPHASVYDGLRILLDALERDDDQVWPFVYVTWELGLLGELGFGLDLSECAATGQKNDLIYVSPRSGKAVSAAAGEPYKGQVLPLPPFLTGNDRNNSMQQAMDGMHLAGHFLSTHVYREQEKNQPEARARFARALRRISATGR